MQNQTSGHGRMTRTILAAWRGVRQPSGAWVGILGYLDASIDQEHETKVTSVGIVVAVAAIVWEAWRGSR